MALEPTGVSEKVIGSLKSCFVEGDPEQQRRERKRDTDTLPDGHCASLQAFWSNPILLFQSVQRRIRTADRLP